MKYYQGGGYSEKNYTAPVTGAYEVCWERPWWMGVGVGGVCGGGGRTITTLSTG